MCTPQTKNAQPFFPSDDTGSRSVVDRSGDGLFLLGQKTGSAPPERVPSLFRRVQW